MKTITLASGATVPALGQGTWQMGERASARKGEADALRVGIDLGMTLIDTAEMYADGGSEEVVGDAIAGQRDAIFLVSKVYPHNAGRFDAIKACEQSLRRLRTDRLDLYLLHWRGGVPLEETVAAFERLIADGKIAAWGVSNLDRDDMIELFDAPGGDKVATNQVLYNLKRRRIEWDLVPWCNQHGVPLMAYSPVEQGRLTARVELDQIAAKHNATRAQVALAWLLAQPNVIVIPKASKPDHVHDNRGAADITLDADDLTILDRAFPRAEPGPLEML